jgi:RNA polymerase sigma-70 factor, ECF subfamily
LADEIPENKPYSQWDPDVQLMLAVQQGNAAAFEEIVRRYQGRLLTVIRHLVPDGDAAEDLVQEVFLRVFRARFSYTPTARFATWIFTVAQNVASNARRNRARRREVQVASAGDGSQEIGGMETLAKDASAMMPTRIADRKEASTVIRAAIEQLNERQRLALLLCKFEGMNHSDIAQTMKMSAHAVKSLLARARANLRDALEPYLQDGFIPSGASHSEPELPTS